MNDIRIELLARNLLDYSIDIKQGEKLYIESSGLCTSTLVGQLIDQATRRGAVPFWFYNDDQVLRNFIKSANADQMASYGKVQKMLMLEAQAYIGIRGSDNPFTLSDIDNDTMNDYMKHVIRPVHLETRLNKTRWCVLRYPNDSMAQLAEMPRETFEDYYFKVCNLDYRALDKASFPLKQLFDATDKVRILGPETDLSFSIQGKPGIACVGNKNIPDGEVYTAPIRDSVNGRVRFNCPTVYRGQLFNGIVLNFENGKIVDASCDNDNKALNAILDIDQGSRHLGEFALGINPFITKPMKDTLFDEKIHGSFHLAIGNSYEDETHNGNVSSIHWDLVSIQTETKGGGEIYFDDSLIRKNGLFLPENLRALSDSASFSS